MCTHGVLETCGTGALCAAPVSAAYPGCLIPRVACLLLGAPTCGPRPPLPTFVAMQVRLVSSVVGEFAIPEAYAAPPAGLEVASVGGMN
jgi:hypothetical protein